ncbi:hypothetical protein AURDEDRAFT_177640 [Auricularia subglabra TFB-10046 SS5]|uniref:Uncharacterized protein n=1 Tax=Auricularia subglabra (strain TFB-10046 / SS5) TaxID=717982 RepID=J0WLS4_AURST|nr:hypothetical protein AURDEDRAFT_177640 [Auricularia subglabra TFB-10046 SS5]
MRFQRGDRRIDLVCTHGCPIYCILSFHCTLVMNFITWNKAYSVYAFRTLIREEGLVLRVNNQRTRRALEKYERRGFTLIEWRNSATGSFTDSFRAKERWIGDSSCWVRQLDTSNVLSQYIPSLAACISFAVPTQYALHVNGFAIIYRRAPAPPNADGVTRWVAHMDCTLLSNGSLSQSYAVSNQFYDQHYT